MPISSTTIQGDPTAPAAPVSYSDTTATANVTAQDVGSATTTGANSQVFILGTPTAGSVASFAVSAIDTIRVQVSGIWTGTIVTELSNDGGTLWVQANTVQQTGLTTSTGSFTSNFHGTVNIAGATNFRVRATTAWTGTAIVRVVETSNSNSIFLSGGSLSVANATLAVTQSGTWNLNNISGTISLPTGASTSANQTNGTQKTQIVDGSGNVIASTMNGLDTVDVTPDDVITGTITALNGTVIVPSQGSYTVSASITGTWSATLIAEGQLADNTWVILPMSVVTGTLPWNSVFSITTNGTYLITGGPYSNIRIRASTFASGTVAVALDASIAQQTIFSAQLGNWTTRIVGNTGAVIDAPTTQNVTTPAAGIAILGEFNTAPTTITNGNSSPLQLTSAANLKIDNTSWLGSTAPTVGSKTSANSIPVVIASDQGDIPTSLNALVTAKTLVMKTGSLVTTATTADQVILTYTVTAGKTFYLEYVSFMAYVTTLPGNTNPVLLGTISLENPSGTKLITNTRIHADYSATVFPFNDPLPVAAGTVIRVVTTPIAATSFTWRANFGGYEA